MEDITRKIGVKDGDPDSGEPMFDATLEMIDQTTGESVELIGPDTDGWYEYTLNSELEGHELKITASNGDKYETIELEGLLIPDDVPEDNYRITLNPITPPGPTPGSKYVTEKGDLFPHKLSSELIVKY